MLYIQICIHLCIPLTHITRCMHFPHFFSIILGLALTGWSPRQAQPGGGLGVGFLLRIPWGVYSLNWENAEIFEENMHLWFASQHCAYINMHISNICGMHSGTDVSITFWACHLMDLLLDLVVVCIWPMTPWGLLMIENYYSVVSIKLIYELTTAAVLVRIHFLQHPWVAVQYSIRILCIVVSRRCCNLYYAHESVILLWWYCWSFRLVLFASLAHNG